MISSQAFRPSVRPGRRWTRTRDRRIPADLRVLWLATVPPTSTIHWDLLKSTKKHQWRKGQRTRFDICKESFVFRVRVGAYLREFSNKVLSITDGCRVQRAS
ncbi:hypothetical protein PoB_007211100 [Plakobranchus ocellatus]|uniref:Uncharacterized protein n=1 Tax=Plakobranchus ocellatus TaxID=259542 RepID=A0AAV4DN92_9GAST|nr:hypothetical protein PoB_007211100 [Plakobranchus ocellatus]